MRVLEREREKKRGSGDSEDRDGSRVQGYKRDIIGDAWASLRSRQRFALLP